jgi:tetratricopeptide (TPR) repeat protein
MDRVFERNGTLLSVLGPFGYRGRGRPGPYKGAGLWRMLAVVLALVPVGGLARQTVSGGGNARQGSKISPGLREAEELLGRGSVDEAKKKIEEEIQRNPSSVDGYTLLGIVYTDEKDYANALQVFQQALQLDPNSTRALNNLGNLYVAEKKLELAEKEFRRVVRLEPGNRDGNYNLGLVLMATGSPVEAIAHLQRVHPADAATRLNLTRAYLRAGRTAEGLKMAAELSAQKQDDVELHFTLGVLLASEKQYRAGQVELEKANALKPENVEILDELGEAAFHAHDYARAELVVNRALKLKPDSPETLYLLAQVYQTENRPVDAMNLLVNAHKLAPENTDIILLLARVSMSQNYFEDAIPLLESGLKIAPQRADLHAALGESYFKSEKTEKAIAEFQKLIELEPSAQSYAFTGISYRRLGRFDKAREYFEAGLKRDPHNAFCLFNIGYIEERQGRTARAEELFQQALRAKPDFSEALLELADLRIAGKRFEEAAVLLRKYVKVSREPASGYYKLAMVEKSLHQSEASQRDLNVFQTLSKDSVSGPRPYQHIFDYVDERSSLSREARTQQDLADLSEQLKKNPDHPEGLYLLAQTYLNLGRREEALKTIAQLDQISAGDYRTQTGVGVLLARYHLYDDAMQHFQAALRENPDADDVKFDIADAYFRKGDYAQALDTAQRVSATGQKDDAFLALLGDVYAHLGETARATEIFLDAINRNPDNDQYYLSLALVELRANDANGAEETLRKGLARIPSSGKIFWGLGTVCVLAGKTAEAEEDFERAVNLLPEWPGSYSALGFFYFETGEIAKAREVLDRFKGSNAAGGLDINRIEEALSRAPESGTSQFKALPMAPAARLQFLQLALTLADRTL